MSYVLDLKSVGVELRFDAKTQRLELIRIYDLSKLELSYNARQHDDSPFSTIDSTPNLQQIFDKFGPTFPGRYNHDKTAYVLEYPGLAFSFPVVVQAKSEGTFQTKL